MRREGGLSVGFRLVMFPSLSNREFHTRGSEDRFDTLTTSSGTELNGLDPEPVEGF